MQGPILLLFMKGFKLKLVPPYVPVTLVPPNVTIGGDGSIKGQTEDCWL